MIKEGQSILDFINFFPLKSVNVRRSPISNKEAQAIYAIWESDRDNWGNPLVPEDLDPMIVSGLITKGYLEGMRNVASVLDTGSRSVTITKKGKDIVRNIVLLTESNTFDKESKYKNVVDYEGIHRALTDGAPTTAEAKTASSWLQKITKASQWTADSDFADVDVRRLHGELYELKQYAEAAVEKMDEIRESEVESRIMADPKEGTQEFRASIDDCINAIGEYQLQQMGLLGEYLQNVLASGRLQGPANGSDAVIPQQNA